MQSAPTACLAIADRLGTALAGSDDEAALFLLSQFGPELLPANTNA